MKIFTIEHETNNVSLHATREEAELAPGAELFTSADEFGDVAANWTTSRLIEIWNGLPGVTPVNKFKDRKTALTRIWNAIQSFGQEAQSDAEPEIAEETLPISEEAEPEPTDSEQHADVCEQAPDVALLAEPPTKKTTRKAKAPTGEKVVKAPREESKTSRVIAMLKREGGATLEEIMTEMGWLKHTTRAMLSAGGSLTKNHGLVVTSEMVGDRRTYSIKA
jgi:hypothetical protein